MGFGFRRAYWRLRNKLERWRISLRLGIDIPPGCVIAPTAQVQMSPSGFAINGAVRLSPAVRLADGVILAPFGGTIEIGERAAIGPYTVIYGHGGVRIGRDALIAPHVVIIAANHRFEDFTRPINEQGDDAKGITIGDNVWIGSNVTILDGVALGNGCVIGAGSVVSRSIEPMMIAYGVPAKQQRRRGFLACREPDKLQ